MSRARILFPAIAFLCLSLSASASSWPQFRGPDSNGLTSEEQLPSEWDADTNVVWTSSVPGKGWASPIIWGDKVFISTAVLDESTLSQEERERMAREEAWVDDDEEGEEGEEEEPEEDEAEEDDDDEEEEEEEPREPPTTVYSWELYCLDRLTGEVLWNRVAHKGTPLHHSHPANTYASETPVTDGEYVYVVYGMVGVFCYDFDGKLIWEKDLGFQPMLYDFGTSSSPALAGNNLFIQIDNEGDSFILALDKRTGEEQWRKSRDESSNWSSPVIWKNKVRTELVTSGITARSYDPETGDILWSMEMPGQSIKATPAGDSDRIIIGSRGDEGAPSYLISVRAGAQGDITPDLDSITNDGVEWMQKNAGPSTSSPLIYGGSVYILGNDRGRVSSYDVETGTPHHEGERLKGARAFWASPWGYDGKVFCLDERGTTHVLAAGSSLEVIGQNKIRDRFWASPAIAEGGIVLRGTKNIYCVKNPS
jgi:outer membrane protein assembly factor BamB